MESNTKIMQEQSVRNQYLAALVVNLLTVSFGICEAWSSPAVLLLTSDLTPLPSGKITIEEASWIVSILRVGGLFGNIFFGYITSKFGRKIPLIVITVPTIFSSILVIYAPNTYYLCVARFLGGFFGAGGYVIVSLFLSEIANVRIRGALVSSLVLMENVGMLLSLVLGNYCDFYVMPKVMIGLTILFGVLLIFFPESPNYLVKQNRIAEAEKSIRFYHNFGEGEKDDKLIDIEMNKLKNTVSDGEINKSNENTFVCSDLKKKSVHRAIRIGLVLVVLNQFSGVNSMLAYTATIFQEAGSNMSPNMSGIIIGVIQVLSAIISTKLVDRVGRKLLFAISNFGTALGLILLGVYMTLKKNGYPVEAFNWVPIVSFSFVIFVAALGIFSIVIIVLAEIMPEKIKDFGVSVCMTLMWTFSFITIKYLPLLTEQLGFDASMFLFAGVCVACELFIIFYMPETKNKSHEEIMNELSL